MGAWGNPSNVPRTSCQQALPGSPGSSPKFEVKQVERDHVLITRGRRSPFLKFHVSPYSLSTGGPALPPRPPKSHFRIVPPGPLTQRASRSNSLGTQAQRTQQRNSRLSEEQSPRQRSTSERVPGPGLGTRPLWVADRGCRITGSPVRSPGPVISPAASGTGAQPRPQ